MPQERSLILVKLIKQLFFNQNSFYIFQHKII